MSGTLQCGAASASVQNANTTQYVCLAAVGAPLRGSEVKAQIIYRSPGTLANLYIRLSANTVTAASTLKSRKGGANGAQSVSITASTTGEFQDVSNTDAVAAGDKWAAQLVMGATGTSLTITALASTFLASTATNAVTRIGMGSNGTIWTTANSYFFAPVSQNTTNTTEANARFTLRSAASLTNLHANVTANTSANATTFGSRVNTAAGALTISVAANTTGFVEDTTHTDTLSSGAAIDLVLTTAASASITVCFLGADLITTNGVFVALQAGSGWNITGATSTNFIPLGGSQGVVTTESQAQQLATVAFTASHLQMSVSGNSTTGSSTLTFRKNAGNGSQTVSIGAGSTGLFEDVSNSDSVAATDEVNYLVVAGASGAKILTMQFVGVGSASQATAFTTTISDPEAGTDARTQASIAAQTVADPEGLSDSTPRLLSRTLASESEALSDSQTRALGHAQTDTEPLSDAASWVAAYAPALTDPEALTDGRSQTSVAARSVTDVEAPADVRSQASGTSQTVTDPEPGTDTQARALGVAQTDAEALSDGRTQASASRQTIGDAESQTDLVILAFSRPLSDAQQLGDGAAQASGFSQIVTNAEVATDALSQVLSSSGFAQTIDDVGGLTDALGERTATSRLLADPEAGTDAVAARDLARALSNVEGLGDGSAQASVVLRTASDPSALGDALSRALGVLQGDTGALSDAVVRALARALGDAEGLADASMSAMAALRLVGETLDSADVVSQRSGTARFPSDPEALADTTSMPLTHVVDLSDSEGLADAVALALAIALVNTEAGTDGLVQLLTSLRSVADTEEETDAASANLHHHPRGCRDIATPTSRAHSDSGTPGNRHDPTPPFRHVPAGV